MLIHAQIPSEVFSLSSNKIAKACATYRKFLVTLHFDMPTLQYFFSNVCARNLRKKCEKCAPGMASHVTFKDVWAFTVNCSEIKLIF